EWFQTEAEVIHTYVFGRMAVSSDEKINVTIRPPDTRPCPIRGLAKTDSPTADVIVFGDEKTSTDHVLGVLAHEVGHVAHHHALKAGDGSMFLTEGLATWASGKYWEAWQKVPMAEMVRSFQREKRYIPLADYDRLDNDVFKTESGNCLAQRDLIYT